MNLSKLLKNSLLTTALLTGALAVAVPASAVTDEEFEKARTIAAKVYIRYTDNQSDYLDDKNPATMGELESIVSSHPKDVELLNEFRSKPTASDYADWGKQELVAYWSNTFFQGSGLNHEAESLRKGKIQAGIRAMKVTEPAAEPVDTAATLAPPARDEVMNVLDEADQRNPLDSQVQSDTLAAGAVAQEAPASNNTWIYIVVLCLLVVIVVILSVYAANMMKKGKAGQAPAQPIMPENRPRPVVEASTVPQPDLETRRALARLNNELAEAKRQHQAVCDENNRLRRQVSQLEAELAASKPVARPAAEPVAPEAIVEGDVETAPQPKPQPRPKPVSRNQRIIFLGRANKDKIFVRADKAVVKDKTIYRLITGNGVTGTFIVEPEAADWIKDDPAHWLNGAAEMATMNAPAHWKRVMTDTQGTAIFEDGCWKVIRPAAVHFE